MKEIRPLAKRAKPNSKSNGGANLGFEATVENALLLVVTDTLV
jgi:hypothetical protein